MATGRTKVGKPSPGCKAILLCERVRKNRRRRLSILNLVNDIVMSELPAYSEPMQLFLQLVDGIGTYDLYFEVHDLQTGELLGRTVTALRVDFPDRPHHVNLVVPVPALPIRGVGRYDVIVLIGNQELDRQQFVIEPEEEVGDV